MINENDFPNFGGIELLSTVDWEDEIAMTIFLRGCPFNCWYCHNREIRSGENRISINKLYNEIDNASLFIDALVLSGGEPTMQHHTLEKLFKHAKTRGLKTGIQTCGINPTVIYKLIENKLLDAVFLDIKTTWEKYYNLVQVKNSEAYVSDTLFVCEDSIDANKLEKFVITTTVFENNLQDVFKIINYIQSNKTEYVIQQGNFPNVEPISYNDLYAAANKLVADSNRQIVVKTKSRGKVIINPNSFM